METSIENCFNSIKEKTGSIPKIVVFDVPNGYIKSFHNILTQFRKKYPITGVIAGNIVTPEGVQILADCGVDAVKFQKRTIEQVYSKEELEKSRQSPWGTTTRQQKDNK